LWIQKAKEDFLLKKDSTLLGLGVFWIGNMQVASKK